MTEYDHDSEDYRDPSLPPGATCWACGQPATVPCDWGYASWHDAPCGRFLCGDHTVVTTDDAGGGDLWCAEHGALACQHPGIWLGLFPTVEPEQPL